MQTYKNIDEYIAQFPTETQTILNKMRVTIHKSVPDLEEKMSYGIPTFALKDKNIVHFGSYDKHIGFYPGAFGVAHFKDKLKGYKTAKGSIQFPLDKPIPYDLVAEITETCAIQRLK